MRAMPARLPLLTVLLLSALLLAAGAAHGAPALPRLQVFAAEEEPFEDEVEAEEEETECDSAYEEADEGVLTEEEAEQICEEEDTEARPAAKSLRGNGEHHAHKRKKACRHKSPARKRRCRRDRQGGGSNSPARGGATGQAGRRTPTSE
jgi:hypothetical protein